jgi:diaminopimelate epimerase
VSEQHIPFAKAHALGNDFLVVNAEDAGVGAPEKLALRMCDRHTGIGADGLVLLGHARPEGASFRIYNSDGSEATLSGNALRCAAAVLTKRKGSTSPASQAITFATRVGPRTLSFLGRKGPAWIFRAEMGAPSFAAADVPFKPPRPAAEPIVQFPLPVGDVTLPATILFMGNPQCIVFLDEDPSLDWMAIGPEIERHPYFPDRANVGFVRTLGSNRIEARFWERGAGHTLASGTGSCACAVAAHLAGKTGRKVTVEVERGAMEVNWREERIVELMGPAEIVAEGTFTIREGLAKTAPEAGA